MRRVLHEAPRDGWLMEEDEGYPLSRSDPHDHQWEDLEKRDGIHRQYMAVYCILCGETQVD